MVNLHMVKGFLSFFDVVTSIQLYGAYIILGLLGSAFFYEPEINEEFKKKSSNNAKILAKYEETHIFKLITSTFNP